MINNRLRLTNEETEFIKTYYKNVDLNNLMFLAEGMTSLTNLDLLESAIRFDLDHDKYVLEKEKEIANDIVKKSSFYKSNGGRNYVEGLDAKHLCEKADELSIKALSVPIEDNLYRIDQIINYIRTDKSGYTSKDLQRMAIYLGTAAGEIMLKDSLLDRGYDWDYVDNRKHPVICNTTDSTICNPMGLVYKKLQYDNSNEDIVGTVEDFYYRFQDLINSKQ